MTKCNIAKFQQSSRVLP